jgi:UDP-N-acetylglucosamine 1-carboxyvinyltransferase
MLIAMGARIEGMGSNVLTIHGGAPLHGCTHTIGPDHIEVGSFIGLAAVTRSELRIANAGVEHLRSVRLGFERLGVVARVEGDDLLVPADQVLRIRSDLGGAVPKLEDQPWPAFPADLMSIAIVTATQCDGIILMHEKMFESRLFFVDKLVGMGARIVLCDPHRALVSGPTELRGATVESPTSAPAWRCSSPRCAPGHQHHQQHRADRARLRAHRRAPRRARSLHPARRVARHAPGPPRAT